MLKRIRKNGDKLAAYPHYLFLLSRIFDVRAAKRSQMSITKLTFGQ